MRRWGIPVTGGNVSFYNQTRFDRHLPTPVVGVLGVIDDVTRRIPTGFGNEPGETLILLGDTADEFDGRSGRRWSGSSRRRSAPRRPRPGEVAGRR